MSGFRTADSGPWSLGVLVWLPTLAILVAAALIAARILYRYSRTDAAENNYDDGPAKWLAYGLVVFAALLVIATLIPGIGMYPYKAEYHQWRNVSGTVEKIDHRLIGNGKGMEDKYVVRFADSGGRQFGCDDTRCASVRAGDWLELSCKRVWQYTGTDGYDCRFSATKAVTR